MSNCTVERQMVIALVVQCGIAAMSPDLRHLVMRRPRAFNHILGGALPSTGDSLIVIRMTLLLRAPLLR